MESRPRARLVCSALTFAATIALVAVQARAADPKDKGLFDRAAVEPFVLMISWPGYFLDIYGIAERPGGGFWIVGDAIENATGESEGYLAAIDDGGLVVEEHALRVAGAAATEFWWPAPLADGRLAVALAVDPFDPATSDGGVAIIGENGPIDRVRLLSELGLPGGEILHVTATPDGLVATGAATARDGTGRDAVVIRFDNDLNARWVATDTPSRRGLQLYAFASVMLDDGSVVSAGSANDDAFSEGVGWVAAFDDSGRLAWRRWVDVDPGAGPHGGAERSGVNWLTALPQGGVAHVQNFYDSYSEPVMSLIAETSAAGEPGFEHVLDLPASVELLGLTMAEDGDMLVGGCDFALDRPVVARVSRDGAVRWDIAFMDIPGGCVWGLIETEDGAIVAAGSYYGDNDTAGGFVVGVGPGGERS